MSLLARVNRQTLLAGPGSGPPVLTKSPQCGRCERTFQSQQALLAHLRGRCGQQAAFLEKMNLEGPALAPVPKEKITNLMQWWKPMVERPPEMVKQVHYRHSNNQTMIYKITYLFIFLMSMS